MIDKNLLSEEINSQVESLKNMELGTEQYETTVDGIAKLSGQLLEIEKLEAENSFKTKQAEEDRKDKKFGRAIAAAGIAVPAGVTIWGTLKTFAFEKESTVTTMIGRGFVGGISRMLNLKK